MIKLNVNQRHSYSMTLRPHEYVTITGSVSVYKIERQGSQPVPITPEDGNIGPFDRVTPILITTASSADIYGPLIAVGGGSGGGGGVSLAQVNSAITTALSDERDETATMIANAIRTASTTASFTVATADYEINPTNFNGSALMVMPPEDEVITVTIADEIPANSTGVILCHGEGEVTIVTDTRSSIRPHGKSSVISGTGKAVQWFALEDEVILIGPFDNFS